MSEHHTSDADIMSAEEWSLIRALRRLGQPITQVTDRVSSDDLAGAYRRLESELFENIGATLDRMIDRADRTSSELDALLLRLSETAAAQRPAA